jgi:transglutaminase-like putative cysteine protease
VACHTFPRSSPGITSATPKCGALRICEGAIVLYDVSHRTVYRYSIPVSFSHHVMRLTPRFCAHQTCHRTALSVTPTPAAHTTAIDYFGNPVTFITINNQHRELSLLARSVIEVLDPPSPQPETTTPWDRIFDALSFDTSSAGLDALQFCFDTPQTRSNEAIRTYTLASFPPGRPILVGAIELMHRIHREFTFDPTATTVSTPPKEVFTKRRGVCQDFAHLQIAGLRSLTRPARYVSGYLLTRPPPGRQERLIGADASHAWLSIWCPGHGWVDLDPTNDMIPSIEHISIAWGREYSDVSPISGAIFGGGAHTVQVAVDVHPIRGAA